MQSYEIKDFILKKKTTSNRVCFNKPAFINTKCFEKNQRKIRTSEVSIQTYEKTGGEGGGGAAQKLMKNIQEYST